MIGYSCPPLSVRPFHEAAAYVLPHFEHWEIVSEAEHFLPDIESQVKELLETTHLKISIHAPYSDINPAAFDERTRQYSVKVLCEIIDISHRLGIGPVTVHPGVIHPIQRTDTEKVLRLTRKSLEEISRVCRNCSAQVGLENMPEMKGTICRTADEMTEMLDGLEMGMCFDIGHANTARQIPELMNLKKRFVNMHVHDNEGKTDQHLDLGRGNIDFTSLRGLKYSGNHIIEANAPDMKSAVASKLFLQRILE
jgi:sugar phosphate isomerase/epimerase